MRILDVKTGPFYEHSSQLHSIAVGVPNWGKVNSGLFKMYQVRTLLDLTYLFYSMFNAAGGGVRETSCCTAYSVRGFVGVGQRSHTSCNWASDNRTMDIYSYPDFKHASSIDVDPGIGPEWQRVVLVMPKFAERLRFIPVPNLGGSGSRKILKAFLISFSYWSNSQASTSL